METLKLVAIKKGNEVKTKYGMSDRYSALVENTNGEEMWTSFLVGKGKKNPLAGVDKGSSFEGIIEVSGDFKNLKFGEKGQRYEAKSSALSDLQKRVEALETRVDELCIAHDIPESAEEHDPNKKAEESQDEPPVKF